MHQLNASTSTIMKRLIIFISAALIILLMSSAGWHMSRLTFSMNKNESARLNKIVEGKVVSEKIKVCAKDAKHYTIMNHLNTQLCFLIDMHMESGRYRFFVYDLVKDIVAETGLVTHGCCNQYWLNGKKYGNSIGCGCTSLGKYKIGIPYYGRFGLAYKLHGLDSSNSHAYSRFVVLHSMQCVAEDEFYPLPICQSDGCPAVSPGFLKKLAPVINSSKLPVLLWIVD